MPLLADWVCSFGLPRDGLDAGRENADAAKVREISAVEVRRRRIDPRRVGVAASTVRTTIKPVRGCRPDLAAARGDDRRGVPLPWPHLVTEFDVPANSVACCLTLLLVPLSKPHPRAPTVLVNELDAGRLDRRFCQSNRAGCRPDSRSPIPTSVEDCDP